MVVVGSDLEGVLALALPFRALPEVEGVLALALPFQALPLPLVEGLQGELPPLALEHADPAPSLKLELARPSPPDGLGR